MISIHVVGVDQLKSNYSVETDIAPFFYYQFYNFDERYSSTVHGSSAVFDDVQPYEVTQDHKFEQYLNQENLEVIFFDDNAPVSGVAKSGFNANAS